MQTSLQVQPSHNTVSTCVAAHASYAVAPTQYPNVSVRPKPCVSQADPLQAAPNGITPLPLGQDKSGVCTFLVFGMNMVDS